MRPGLENPPIALDRAGSSSSSLKMKRALIIGSSGGIGQAMSAGLAVRGVEVTKLSRAADGLDLMDEESVRAAFEPLDGSFDLIFVATGALEIDGARPEKTLRDITQKSMLDQFMLNCVGPALILKHARKLLPRDRRGIFAALSARVGSIGDNRLGGWYGYRTAKAALNQVIHSAAIELARTHEHLICVALHPGTVATPFTQKYLGRHPAVTPQEAAANLLRVMDRLNPEDTGGFFDWKGKAVPW